MAAVPPLMLPVRFSCPPLPVFWMVYVVAVPGAGSTRLFATVVFAAVVLLKKAVPGAVAAPVWPATPVANVIAPLPNSPPLVKFTPPAETVVPPEYVLAAVGV